MLNSTVINVLLLMGLLLPPLLTFIRLRHTEINGLSKLLWMWIVIQFPIVGFIAYLLIEKAPSASSR
ncbi:MAG: PLDc N-terminal domain-containing protein [Anaerolineae bacterium]|jgi:hypothetical protein|nr:PLDc N-terminal domain-containing protein [Anaerolineae bacterium]